MAAALAAGQQLVLDSWEPEPPDHVVGSGSLSGGVEEGRWVGKVARLLAGVATDSQVAELVAAKMAGSLICSSNIIGT